MAKITGKRYFALLFIAATCWGFISCSDNIERHNIWVKKSSPDSTYRNYPPGFSIGGKGYIGMGYVDVALTDWWQSDPSKDAWVKKKDFPGTARIHSSFTSDQTYGYVGLGYKFDFTPLNDIWKYDPSNDSWTLLTSAPFSAKSRVPIFFVLNNNLFVVNGIELWMFDPSAGVWQRKKDMPFNGQYAVFTRNGRSLIINGEVYFLLNDRSTKDPNELAETASFWKYDAVADSWTSLRTNLSLGKIYWSGAFNIGSKIFVPVEGFRAWRTLDISDPKSEFNYVAACELKGAENGGVGYSIDDKGYILSSFGGEHWQYIP